MCGMDDSRPFVGCHMLVSQNGRVTGDFLADSACADACEAYYDLNRDDSAQAFACGRVTMEGSFTGGWQPEWAQWETVAVTPGDFVAPAAAGARRFAVAFDRCGRLGWKAACIEDADPGYGGAHVVEVLSSAVTPAHLAYFREVGVSYIVADDLCEALVRLRALFGVERLLLEGGAVLNEAFLTAGLVDELSLVHAPLMAEPGDAPLFATTPLPPVADEVTRYVRGIRCTSSRVLR